MKDYLQKMAGVNPSAINKKDENVSEADSIRKMSGLEESIGSIIIEDTQDVDKVYVALAERFQDNADVLNEIKDIFSKVITR
jgi:DNA-directed RNA polymerase subunit F